MSPYSLRARQPAPLEGVLNLLLREPSAQIKVHCELVVLALWKHESAGLQQAQKAIEKRSQFQELHANSHVRTSRMVPAVASQMIASRRCDL